MPFATIRSGKVATTPRSRRVSGPLILMLFLVSGNPILRQEMMPTLAESDELLDAVVANGMKTTDANDLLYQVEASRDYDPGPSLEKIRAPLYAVNSADDFIDPPELGILEREIKRVPKGRAFLIPLEPGNSRPRHTHDRGALEAAPRGAAEGIREAITDERSPMNRRDFLNVAPLAAGTLVASAVVRSGAVRRRKKQTEDYGRAAGSDQAAQARSRLHAGSRVVVDEPGRSRQPDVDLSRIQGDAFSLSARSRQGAQRHRRDHAPTRASRATAAAVPAPATSSSST